MKDRGENIEIFDYPETAGVGNPELYRVLNERLSVDPNYQLPYGFQRQIHTEFDYVYQVPDALGLPES